MTTFKNITVIGSGAWGTALAQALASAGKKVQLYAREPNLAKEINTNHTNSLYLSGVALNSNIHAVSDIEEAVRDADVLLMVVPTQFTRTTLEQLKPFVKPDAFIVNCSKGIEIASGKLLADVTKEVLPENPYAVLSGPTFAIEVAKGLPAAVTLATQQSNEKAFDLAEALSSSAFRPYVSDDILGVEIAGALKNVIAIACGIVGGEELGANAAAAVMTRGMAEIKRLGLRLGADETTFLGLAGIGDLNLTCNSKLSRNYSLGYDLGVGKTIQEIMEGRTTVAEGYSTTKAVVALAKELEVDMPICQSIYSVLYDGVPATEMISGLMMRHLKAEAA